MILRKKYINSFFVNTRNLLLKKELGASVEISLLITLQNEIQNGFKKVEINNRNSSFLGPTKKPKQIYEALFCFQHCVFG